MTTKAKLGGSLRAAAAGAVICIVMSMTACSQWRGANSLDLPGTEGHRGVPFTVQAQVPSVGILQRNSRVRVGDVTVGNVTNIERQGWHALITMSLNGDVELPGNATATVGQTSLLGSMHVELAAPQGIPPQGKLRDGAVIPLSSGAMYPSTEQTLSAVSMLLNGGGIGQIQGITQSLSTAFAGREHDLRSLIEQLDRFVTYVDDQKDDIIAATESINNVAGQLAAQDATLDKALTTIPQALGVLKDQRQNLVAALESIGNFSGLLASTVGQTKENLVKELSDLGPVLQSLADAGPALTRSLSFFSTYPWPKENIENWVRGDYANLTAVIDLTLSRLDQSLFTGTRFEGDLTELEMQWGRTIGQLPSPYTAGNPLVVPYHMDGGH